MEDTNCLDEDGASDLMIKPPFVTSSHDEGNGGQDVCDSVQPREKIVSKKVVIARDFLVMWASPPGM